MLNIFYIFIAETWPAGTFLVVKTFSIFELFVPITNKNFMRRLVMLNSAVGCTLLMESNVLRHRTHRTSNVNVILCVGFCFRKQKPADFMFQQ